MAIQNIKNPRIRPTGNNIPPALVLDTAKSEQSGAPKSFTKATAPSISRAKKLRRLYRLSGDGCTNIIDHADGPKPHARLLTTICCCSEYPCSRCANSRAMYIAYNVTIAFRNNDFVAAWLGARSPSNIMRNI